MFDAKHLVRAFLELSGMQPQRDTWTEERLANNPPRLVRFRRLVALFRAFGVPFEIASFVRGKFIATDHPNYESIIVAADRELGGNDMFWARRDQLPSFFERLLRYRTALDHCMTFNSGVLEASGLYAYALQLTEEVNETLAPKVAMLDGLLAQLIDPGGRTFGRDELVALGYPTDDLEAIDLDWM